QAETTTSEGSLTTGTMRSTDAAADPGRESGYQALYEVLEQRRIELESREQALKLKEAALKKLQQKAGSTLAGSELLPSKFTLLQLRSLYEAIYQRKFDPGNFRKKMLSLNVLERLDHKNSSESKKGAFYYRVKPNWADEELERIVKY
ncbi:MAG: NrtR DNA-binding winged helix domain-containing protein, partial [Mariniphaga sp.]